MDEIFKNKKRLFGFVGFFLGIVVLVYGVSYGFAWYKDPVREALKNQEIVEEAWRNDTYGGKTPQETLDMFIAALKAGDVELASKYFALDDNLSRKEWEDLLARVKTQNKLMQMSDDLRSYDDSTVSINNYHLFLYRNDDGTVGLQMTLVFNPVSKVWKIESL